MLIIPRQTNASIHQLQCVKACTYVCVCVRPAAHSATVCPPWPDTPLPLLPWPGDGSRAHLCHVVLLFQQTASPVTSPQPDGDAACGTGHADAASATSFAGRPACVVWRVIRSYGGLDFTETFEQQLKNLCRTRWDIIEKMCGLIINSFFSFFLFKSQVKMFDPAVIEMWSSALKDEPVEETWQSNRWQITELEWHLQSSGGKNTSRNSVWDLALVPLDVSAGTLHESPLLNP